MPRTRHESESVAAAGAADAAGAAVDSNAVDANWTTANWTAADIATRPTNVPNQTELMQLKRVLISIILAIAFTYFNYNTSVMEVMNLTKLLLEFIIVAGMTLPIVGITMLVVWLCSKAW